MPTGKSTRSCLAHQLAPLLVAFTICLSIPGPAAGDSPKKNAQAGGAKPDHLLFLVFDQMRPDYIDRYDLKNFKRLRSLGTDFRNGIVGHFPSITIVSHSVMTTGRKPRVLPLNHTVLVDPARHEVRISTAMSADALLALMAGIPEAELLPARLKKRFGGKAIAIGEKLYAATSFGTPAADVIVYLNRSGAACAPAGIRVPTWVIEDPRYSVDCKKGYGSEGGPYTLDGSHFVPGDDPAHAGGDVWAGDLALGFMSRETDWRGLFVTFGAIDKLGHLTGDVDRVHERAVPLGFTLASIVRTADEQLGRLLDRLTKDRLVDRTVIVATADHGAISSRFYLDAAGRATPRIDPRVSDGLRQLRALPGVLAVDADSALSVWLSSDAAGDKAADAAFQLPGVVEVWRLLDRGTNPRYARVRSRLETEPEPFRRWTEDEVPRLLATTASEAAPDLVGVLEEDAGFDLPGSHGGLQEHAQRIPFLIAAPGMRNEASNERITLSDIEGRVSDLMGLSDAAH